MQKIIEQLEMLSPFELYRIKSFIQMKLDDSEFIDGLKRTVKVGQEISYFDKETNRSIDVFVEKIGRTNAHVKEVVSGKRWTMPFYMLNLKALDTGLANTLNHNVKTRGVKKYELSIGDSVSFENDFEELFGKVIKLNPKTARVRLNNGGTWTVYYQSLSKVIETVGTIGGKKLIDIVVVQ